MKSKRPKRSKPPTTPSATPSAASSAKKTKSKARISHGAEVWTRLEAFLSLKSPLTARTYRGILREWCDFIGITVRSPATGAKFASATDLDAVSYRSWLFDKEGQAPRITAASRTPSTKPKQRRNGSPQVRDGTQLTLTNATVNKKLTALRRMYRAIENIEGHVTPNPFNVDRVPPPSPHAGRKRPTRMVDFGLVQRMIEAPDPGHSKGIRDRALLAILFGGGLRRSEASKLRLGDVLTSNAGTTYLRLRSTKAKTDADQAIPPWAETFLQALLEHRYSQGATDDDFLFVGYAGPGGKTPTRRPISPSSIYNVFKEAAQKIGASDFISPHSARATAITKLLVDGVPYREVRQFSRHSSVQMVEVYDKRRLTVDENPGRHLSFTVTDHATPLSGGTRPKGNK